MRMGSAGGAIDSRTGGGGRLLFDFADGAGGAPTDGGGGCLARFELGVGAFGTNVGGRGAGVGARGTAGAGTGRLVISKSGFIPAGGGGIPGLGRAAAASASACLIAANVMPLGNVSVNLRIAASSSAACLSSAGAFGRGAAGAWGLPKVPVGSFGAGGIVGDRRGTGRGAVGTISDCGT